MYFWYSAFTSFIHIAPQIEEFMGGNQSISFRHHLYEDVALGMPFNILAMIMGAILRGSGDMKTSRS